MAKKKNEETEEKKSCECETCTCSENEKGKEYLEMAQRIQAEFDNYRKRSSDIVMSAKIDGIVDAVLRFLPALDAIKKAKTMIKADEKILQGVEMIENELQNALKNLDIEEIDSKGQKFDPNLHNVIAVATDNSLEDGIITDVFQAGYKLKGKIIRYAQVVVNKI